MNALESEYSSGCDSGWTVYLGQPGLSPNEHHSNFIESEICFYSSGKKIVDEDDNDDQSMVSDASSGPPPLTDDINSSNGYFSYTFEGMQNNTQNAGKRKKTKEKRRSIHLEKDQELGLYLDDTASSPTTISKVCILEHSQGFSATRFKVKSK